MVNKNIINKYDMLFASGIEFIFRVNICKQDEVEGASDDEIQEFCNEYNVTLPPAIWSYTRYNGQTVRAWDTDYNCGYTLADYKDALHEASIRNEWHEMMNVKELLAHKNFKVNYDDDCPDDNDGLYTPEISSLMDIENVVPFHYDEFTRSFELFDSSKENPIIFCLTRYYALSSSFSSFTNRYRDVLFVYIVNYAPQDFAEMRIVDGKRVPFSNPPAIDYSDGYECLKVYQEIFKKKDLDRAKLKRLREEFYVINDEVEKSENRILSFTEFENKFIDFMIENGLKY